MSESPTTSGQTSHFDGIVASAVGRAKIEVNLDREGYQRLFKRQGEFEDAFVALVIRLSAKLLDYTLARSILGGDFISPEEIMTARSDVVYTAEQIAQLADTIPSEEVLRALKEGGCALIPQPPSAISLLAVRTAKPEHFYSKTGGWYEEQLFARNDLTGSGWLAIKKMPVANSTNKNWNEQEKLLSKVERVPNIVEMSWFITIFFDVRGVRLFESVYVRTSSLASDGDRVDVGHFDAGGLDVGHSWDDKRISDLGLASARKF